MASIQRRPDGQWRARYRDGQYREHRNLSRWLRPVGVTRLVDLVLLVG